MSDKYILENGELKPVDLMTWAKWFETANRSIAYDEVNGVRVSTVFLGIDHNFFGGPPLLFETTIFGGRHDERTRRCSTLSQAKEMHRKALRLIET